MPATKRPKPLYKRGDFSLYPRAGRNHEIVWYDAAGKRERSASAGTVDLGKAKQALDRLYLTQEGARHCPTCHRPWGADHSPPLAGAIADYLLLSEGKAGEKSARSRLNHVLDYIEEKGLETHCAAVDDAWVDAFRGWLLAKPVTSPKGKYLRERALGAVEGCVLQLAAAVNATPGQSASFKAQQPKDVARSPTYRASVQKMAAMFRHAMAHPTRINLLRYLRFAVATWARPDAIYDAKKVQWYPEARVFDLNPPRRKQTKKHRPKVPVARQFAPFLDTDEAYLTVASIRHAWDAMRLKLKLPHDGEAGEKLIRRSMSTVARKRIGEAQWAQGQMMLGHLRSSISDIYAIPDPANLGLALSVTESIIDEIEALAPGAFYRQVTATGNPLMVIEGGKNG
jgi:hypothetical protein